jgi:signal peptidase II
MRTEAREVGPVTPSFPRSRYWLFGILAGLGLTVDLWSKHAVFAVLGPQGRANWEWRCGDFVRFTLHTNFNHGALWGLGQGWSPLFATLSVAAVIGIAYFLFVANYARSVWLTVALGFVTAGALGNLFDRLALHGWKTVDGRPVYAVRDFLYFRFFDTFDWAIFNLADSLLVTGAIMLVLHSFLWGASPLPSAAAETTQQPHVPA